MVAAALIGLSLNGQAMAEEQAGTGDSTRSQSTFNPSDVLPLIVTSPERQQFGRELEGLLRQGRLKEAENYANAAIDVGTLAILLRDQLRMPHFLAELQALGLQGDDHTFPLPAVSKNLLPGSTEPSAGARAGSTPAELTELRDARDREQRRADAAVRDLEAITEELQSLRARRKQDSASAAASAEQLTELKLYFERERDRADTAMRDLAAMTEEHHTLQKLREQDASLTASNRRQIEELKAALERERQSNQAAAAVSPELERSQDSEIHNPLSMPTAATGLATPVPPNLPEPRPFQIAAAVQTNASGIRGLPSVLNTSTLSLQGRTVHLFGVEADGDAVSARELTEYIGNREVVCEPAGQTDVYRCQVDRKDLSVVVLFNGGGWATSDATAELLLATERARLARVGVWSR
jgi:hypothetical protein